MQDIAVKISKETRMVYKEVAVIGNDGENLQANLIFSFTDQFVNGVARIDYQFENGEKHFSMLEKQNESYTIPVKSILTKVGTLFVQLIINEAATDEVPIFKSNIFRFRVNQSLNATEVEPSEYHEWIDIANEKLAEVENVDIRVEKVENVSTITIINRYGEEQEVEVLDGEQGPQGEPGEGSVDDVLVNNESVLEDKIAKINIPTWSLNPTKPSYDYEEINNKPDLNIYATNQALNAETTSRQNADTSLQNQIDALANANDVVDVLATYQDLLDYDTSHLKNNDIIKVMSDSTHQNAISYFKWVIVEQTGSWSYVGSQGPFYTKAETDTLLNAKQDNLVFNTAYNPTTNPVATMSDINSIVGDIANELGGI